MILISRWLFIFGFGYLLYIYFVCKHDFQIIQFITLMGVLLAFFKDIVIELLLPAVFQIKTSSSKPHFHEFPTSDKDVYESWLSIEIKNIGLSSAKNVLLYFNGIKSNRIKDFDAFLSLPIRKSFGEVPKDKDPLPRPVLVPRNTRFFFSLCYIQYNKPHYIHFNFPRTPIALKEINCKNDEESFFEFDVLVATDNRFAINKRAKFKFFYNGIYDDGFRFE